MVLNNIEIMSLFIYCSMRLSSSGSCTLSTNLAGPSNCVHFCSYFVFYFIPCPFSSPSSPSFTYLMLHFPPPFIYLFLYLLWSLILLSSPFLPFLYPFFLIIFYPSLFNSYF
jgi:hypothetical protein